MKNNHLSYVLLTTLLLATSSSSSAMLGQSLNPSEIAAKNAIEKAISHKEWKMAEDNLRALENVAAMQSSTTRKNTLHKAISELKMKLETALRGKYVTTLTDIALDSSGNQKIQVKVSGLDSTNQI